MLLACILVVRPPNVPFSCVHCICTTCSAAVRNLLLAQLLLLDHRNPVMPRCSPRTLALYALIRHGMGCGQRLIAGFGLGVGTVGIVGTPFVRILTRRAVEGGNGGGTLCRRMRWADCVLGVLRGSRLLAWHGGGLVCWWREGGRETLLSYEKLGKWRCACCTCRVRVRVGITFIQAEYTPYCLHLTTMCTPANTKATTAAAYSRTANIPSVQ